MARRSYADQTDQLSSIASGDQRADELIEWHVARGGVTRRADPLPPSGDSRRFDDLDTGDKRVVAIPGTDRVLLMPIDEGPAELARVTR